MHQESCVTADVHHGLLQLHVQPCGLTQLPLSSCMLAGLKLCDRVLVAEQDTTKGA